MNHREPTDDDGCLVAALILVGVAALIILVAIL